MKSKVGSYGLIYLQDTHSSVFAEKECSGNFNGLTFVAHGKTSSGSVFCSELKNFAFIKKQLDKTLFQMVFSFSRRTQLFQLANLQSFFPVFLFFFYQGFLAQTLTTHRTTGEGRGPSFIQLYHFHPLSNIQTCVCSFAYEMTITYHATCIPD